MQLTFPIGSHAQLSYTGAKPSPLTYDLNFGAIAAHDFQVMSTFPFTHNSHLETGFVRPGMGYVKIGSCARRPLSPIEEAVRAARLIAESTSEPIVLCLSGGVDSEAMALAFLKAEVPFSAAIATYNETLNAFDVAFAIEFCRKHRVPYKIIDIDVRAFLARFGHFQALKLDQCRSPQIAVHLEILDRVEGLPVLSWNPGSPSWSRGILELVLPVEPHLTYLRHFQRLKREGVPFFFAYTPELIHSFWNTPVFRHRLLHRPQAGDAERIARALGRDSVDERKLEHAEKVLAYREGGFDVRPNAMKATGFENVKNELSNICLRHGFEEGCLRDRLFDYLYRRPLEIALPWPKRMMKIVDRTYLPPNRLEEQFKNPRHPQRPAEL